MSVACSAPGKVLLAGGYLVLDRAHSGLVFGLDSRIHVHIQRTTGPEIVVKSPQFPGSVWLYDFKSEDGGAGVPVRQLTSAEHSAPRNPFVETALSFGLSYVSSMKASLEPCTITILADNDYYSASRASENNRCAKRNGSSKNFTSFSEPLWKVNKTGLGSSAALVTSLTAALLSFHLDKDQFDVSTPSGRSRLHNLAQASHCAAQGKVGSGFDVASAVFGSCIYRRFSPSVVESIGEPGSSGFVQSLRDCVDDVNGSWDVSIDKEAVAIPSGLRLVMCDVDCGSQTPGMVKRVLEWRKAKPQEAGKLWQALQRKNDELAAALVEANSGSRNDYSDLRQLLSEARQLIRDMSRESGVPIEPPPQSELLDACSEVPGVVGGVVPGAGGFDAVAILIQDDEATLHQLESLLAVWKFDGSGRVRLLGTKGEMEGVRLEEAKAYDEWTV